MKWEKSSFTLESWNKKQVIVDKDGHFSICVDNPPARFEIEIVKDGKTAAEKTAKEADHVIAVIGCNPVINSKEEVDRMKAVLRDQAAWNLLYLVERSEVETGTCALRLLQSRRSVGVRCSIV